jgi:hypothetical protein
MGLEALHDANAGRSERAVALVVLGRHARVRRAVNLKDADAARVNDEEVGLGGDARVLVRSRLPAGVREEQDVRALERFAAASSLCERKPATRRAWVAGMAEQGLRGASRLDGR